ncbi:Protein translation factor SUI1-like protein, partial [Dichanthelium oligosanthes]
MVLAELDGSIARALAGMSAATVVDDKALADCLNEISRALLQADVHFETVRAVPSNIKAVQRAVTGELCRMLDPGKPPLASAKGKPSVVIGGKAAKGRTPSKDRYLLPAGKKHAKRENEKAKLEADDQFMPGATAAGVGELLLTSFDPFADAERGDGEDGGGVPAAPRDDVVHLRTQQRNGRKSLTTVQGLNVAYNYAKILQDLKRELCCSGIAVEDEDLGNVVQLQGDHRKAVAAFLVKAGIVT